MNIELDTVLTEVAVDGNVKFRIYETDAMREEPLTVLNMSNRGSNALLRNGYRTIGDLIDNWSKLNIVRGLGTKTVQEIKYALCAYQYMLLDPKKRKEYLADIVRLNVA